MPNGNRQVWILHHQQAWLTPFPTLHCCAASTCHCCRSLPESARGALVQHPCAGSGANVDAKKYHLKICNRGMRSRRWQLAMREGKYGRLDFVLRLCGARTVTLREIIRNISPCRC